MSKVRIENPVINSAFVPPKSQFKFDDNGITDEVVSGRRPSSYFVPIAGAKGSKTGDSSFDTEWTRDRIEENQFINDVRQNVDTWRLRGYPGVTPTTRQLLSYWNDPEREKKLFFCQIEALETVIYITEVAKSQGDGWMANHLNEAMAQSNPGLFRMALKMATGTGKTVVMGMLIVWHSLNKSANPRDRRFSDAFLLVAPGITIRDRLRVLLPGEDSNYYRERDLVPIDRYGELLSAEILITNFHTFQLRDKLKIGKLNKSILQTDGLETPDQMVRRVCRTLGNKKNIVVLNDEAHHCYRRKPDDLKISLNADERSEARAREQEAKVWVSGLEAVGRKLGIKAIYDLSATPFFLKGSGYPEGTLFPWVVSDFSLIDAIESGIVKVPRVPVSDDSRGGEEPTYRDLWVHIRDNLPKSGRKTESVFEQTAMPTELEGALHSLYGNYQTYFDSWESDPNGKAAGAPAPTFIVVCNNTTVSKLVFDYVAGWEREIEGKKVVQAGKLEAFRNDDGNGGWRDSPYSILVDSAQLEAGDALTDEFRRVAEKEIEEFRASVIARGGSPDVSDSEILREVMNTVGKPGKLGEKVRCVVSVSMLTEGWDANNVTHVLGVRAFSTQLLCEQVVGRALRRRSYELNDSGLFDPEYAEVYGVPFSFIPANGTTGALGPTVNPTRVRALDERNDAAISFPCVVGYRFDFGAESISHIFDADSHMTLSTKDVPTFTENAPIVGESSVHSLDDLRKRRMNEVAFLLAEDTLTRFFRDSDGNDKPWLYPKILKITKAWLGECIELKDNAFPQLLLLTRLGRNASEKIYRSIASSQAETQKIVPILRPFEPTGSTHGVDFDTVKPVMETDAQKCHVSHVVADTKSWEQKMAQVLESMDEVVAYVKNHKLGFSIPYSFEGDSRQYVPDFIARVNLGDSGRLLNLVVEVSGEDRKDKEAKVETARNLWVPAVNNGGRFGDWDFVEITDPWNGANLIREHLRARQ